MQESSFCVFLFCGFVFFNKALCWAPPTFTQEVNIRITSSTRASCFWRLALNNFRVWFTFR